MELDKDKRIMRDKEVRNACHLRRSPLCEDHTNIDCNEHCGGWKKSRKTESIRRDISTCALYTQGLLTERELYQIILPVPNLLKIKSFDTTESATRKVPDEPVLLCGDFLAEAFNTHLLMLAHQLLKKGGTSQILAIVEINPDQLMNQLLDDGLNLNEAYNRAVKFVDDETSMFTKYQIIIKSVRQTSGYMVVLMTFDTACLQHMFEHGFSTVIVTIRTLSIFHLQFLLIRTTRLLKLHILECMYFLETLSTRDRTAQSSPSTYSDEKDDVDDGNGRSGVIFEAKLCGKVGTLQNLYKNEYLLQEFQMKSRFTSSPLMDIQYIHTPKFLKFGILHEAFVFILISHSGKSFADLDDITERENLLAIEGLQAIHARGVMHGDVRLENIMVDRSESIIDRIEKFTWYDR
ncbi:1063_t:CDS:2 [Funneliformis geosporum]|nr:1063_t:CDS:2 [Funneliformis geosporum]